MSASRSRSVWRSRWQCGQAWPRALSVLWGPLVGLAVVATGNHFVFDIATGLLVTALGFVAGRLVARLVSARARLTAPGSATT